MTGLVACSCVLATCGRGYRFDLSIDFSNASQWRYLLGVDITGSLQGESGKQSLNGSARTWLQGAISAHDTGIISFTTSGTRIQSNFLDENEMADIENRFSDMSLSFSPHEGAVYLPDTARIPVVSLGGWDLCRNFIRVIPILPETPVTPGATWDRERQFPLSTTHGSAIGHLFQSFRFDSVRTIGDTTRTAEISWLFTYRIEPVDSDTASLLKNFPLTGEGQGSASLNLTEKALLRADASFGVSGDSTGIAGVLWNESIHMELVD